VTGAAGWIGSHLAAQLAEDNTVYAWVRPGSDLWRLRSALGSLQVVDGDLADASAVAARIGAIRPEVCLHVAWYAVPGAYRDSRENLGALEASIRLAVLLQSVGCRRFIGVGSCFEYDTELGRPLSEDSPTRPRTMYAAAKLAFQLVLERLAASGSMRHAWARLFYLYGPMEDERRLVPSLINAVMRGERMPLTTEQVRDYLHVADVAGAVHAIAASAIEGVVNVGSGKPIAIADLARRVGDAAGRPELVAVGARPNDPGEPMFICADVTRLAATGWRPTHSLESGLADTIAWWRNRVGAAI